MLQSQMLIDTKKESPAEDASISSEYLVRGGFIDRVASGIYTFLPLGFLVLKKIEKIIRHEMQAIGAQELLLPVLGPRSLWEKTGRWKGYEPPLFKVKDIHGRFFCLSPTHEEVVTELARKKIHSYKDLPKVVFQIQDKFRNELRSSGGLLRTREFLMKDMYSFHANEKESLQFYQKVREAYLRIFTACGLNALCVEADSGVIGGSLSHEFLIESEAGEDLIAVCENCGFRMKAEKSTEADKCPKCGRELNRNSCIEIGHIFFLGDKYSKVMGAVFVNQRGESRPIIMGCYGIGLGRLMASVVESHHDELGIIWPSRVAPFLIHIVVLNSYNKKVLQEGRRLYRSLERRFDVLLDDRLDVSEGEKLKDADLIGIPLRVIVSRKTLKRGPLEVKLRSEKKTRFLTLSQIISLADKLLS